MLAHNGGAPAQITPGYLSLGSLVSAAPAPALLATLQMLRPQWHIRLVSIESVGVPRYQVEIEDDATLKENSHIDIWLHIKSALMATFPADKPNAVTAIDT